MVTGVIVGAVTVGLMVLAKRTPRDKWKETLARVLRDGLRLARMRYGIVARPLFDIAEQILDRMLETSSPGDTPKTA